MGNCDGFYATCNYITIKFMVFAELEGHGRLVLVWCRRKILMNIEAFRLMVGLIVGKSKSMFLISIIGLYLFSSLYSTDPGGTFINISKSDGINSHLIS